MNATTNDTAQWLHEYFIQHGSLTLPGVGTFRIQRISAQVDFASKRMMPISRSVNCTVPSAAGCVSAGL